MITRRKFLADTIAVAVAPTVLQFQAIGTPGIRLVEMASSSEGGYIVPEHMAELINAIFAGNNMAVTMGRRSGRLRKQAN